MKATAADSLSDSISTAAVLAATLIAHFFSVNIDGWVGVAVACFILYAGYNAARDTIDPLLGQAPDPELVTDVEKTVLSFPPIQSIHDMIVHDYGPGRLMISLHAEVPADGDLLEMHDTIDLVEQTLRITVHDFRMVTGPTHTNLIFDVACPFDVKQTDADIKRQVEEIVDLLDGNYNAVVTVDRIYAAKD